MWYRWTSQAAFDSWHDAVIAGLGLPRVGVNAQTGEPQPEKQQTTSYTQAVKVGRGDWRAAVDAHVAEQFLDGLGVESSAPENEEF